MSKPSSIRDTTPEAEAVLIQLIRSRPPTKRIEDAVSSSNRVAEQCKNAIRRSNPQITDEEVRLRFIELNYGPEMAVSVRGYLVGKR